jgi:hypothetical protein
VFFKKAKQTADGKRLLYKIAQLIKERSIGSGNIFLYGGKRSASVSDRKYPAILRAASKVFLLRKTVAVPVVQPSPGSPGMAFKAPSEQGPAGEFPAVIVMSPPSSPSSILFNQWEGNTRLNVRKSLMRPVIKGVVLFGLNTPPLGLNLTHETNHTHHERKTGTVRHYTVISPPFSRFFPSD